MEKLKSKSWCQSLRLHSCCVFINALKKPEPVFLSLQPETKLRLILVPCEMTHPKSSFILIATTLQVCFIWQWHLINIYWWQVRLWTWQQLKPKICFTLIQVSIRTFPKRFHYCLLAFCFVHLWNSSSSQPMKWNIIPDMHTEGIPNAENMNNHPYCTSMKTHYGTHMLFLSLNKCFGKSTEYSFYSTNRLRIRLNRVLVRQRQKIFTPYKGKILNPFS